MPKKLKKKKSKGNFGKLRLVCYELGLKNLAKYALGTFSLILLFKLINKIILFIPFVDKILSFFLSGASLVAIALFLDHHHAGKIVITSFISDWYQLTFKKHFLIITGSIGLIYSIDCIVDYLKTKNSQPQVHNPKFIAYEKY